MRPVDLPFFVELGGALEQASKVDARGPLFPALFDLYRLKNALGTLMAGDRAKLTACGHDLAELLNQLNAFERNHFRDAQGNWISPSDDARSEYELGSIVSKIQQFQNVLIADLRITASFTVTKSGIFDVNQLVNCAHQAVPEDVRKKLTKEALDEIDASGKCLAFSLPTASGFHAMRAVERVIKTYLADFISVEEIGRLKNWGQYLDALEKRATGEALPKPSSEAIALIRQIKDIYRNPVIHPNRVLSSDEAMALFHSTLAAIGRIAAELSKKEPKLPGLLGSILGGEGAGAAALLGDSTNDTEAA
jgi:hypothetical protein